MVIMRRHRRRRRARAQPASFVRRRRWRAAVWSRALAARHVALLGGGGRTRDEAFRELAAAEDPRASCFALQFLLSLFWQTNIGAF